MPELPGLKVVRSSIHGYGVVATRDFKKGEKVVDVDGVVIFDEEEEVDWDDNYALKIDEGVFFDMVDQTRWINHSCEPNLEVDGDVKDDRTVWAHMTAKKDIKSGEELAYDYSFPAEIAEPCACGTATCRGYIVDEEEADQVQTRRKKKAHVSI